MYYLVIDLFGPLGGLAGGTDTTDGHLATRPWEVLTVPVMSLVFPSPLCAKDSILPQTSGEVILHIANLSLLFDFLFCVFGEIILCKYAFLQLAVGSNTPRSYK